MHVTPLFALPEGLLMACKLLYTIKLQRYELFSKWQGNLLGNVERKT